MNETSKKNHCKEREDSNGKTRRNAWYYLTTGQITIKCVSQLRGEMKVNPFDAHEIKYGIHKQTIVPQI
jgi:hypothetical protein